tara:strand:+ start:946 stop:1140 length:195 start_codon:yes stop_codon:yes gene_type:complete
MIFALATPELGVSSYFILILSLAIWLGAPAYFLFKSDKGQKSAFSRESPQKEGDGSNGDEVVVG